VAHFDYIILTELTEFFDDSLHGFPRMKERERAWFAAKCDNES
jgi:hypothetical protein